MALELSINKISDFNDWTSFQQGRYQFTLINPDGVFTKLAGFPVGFDLIVSDHRPPYPERDLSETQEAIMDQFPSARFGRWQGTVKLYMSEADRGMLELLADRG